MRSTAPVDPFHTTEKVLLKRPISTEGVRQMILDEGFSSKEIRFAKTFFGVMLCRHPDLLPRGEHLVVWRVRNVVSKKEPRQIYIQFEMADRCSTVVPLPPSYVDNLPPKIIERNSSWLRECRALYCVRDSFKKPKVLKFKTPLDLVDGMKSSNVLVSASPALVYDLDNNQKIALSVDLMAQIALASEHTVYEANIV